MAKAAIRKHVPLFRTGVQTPGNVGWPIVFNKARLEEWVKNTNDMPVHAAINFGRHVKNPAKDTEELYAIDDETQQAAPIFGAAENWRIEDDKESPGRHLLFADIRTRDRAMAQAIGKNFPGPSLTIRRGADGKERITSVTFLGKAEPPAIEGLPAPPSTVVEAAVFQKYVEGETGGNDTAYTVTLEEPEEIMEFDQQEEPTMAEKDTNLAAELKEVKAVVAEAREVAAESKNTKLEFSKEINDLKTALKEQREENKALAEQLRESKTERIKSEAMTFAKGQVKNMVEKHGLAKAHADRIQTLIFAMRTGEDKLTFSGETDEKPLADQAVLVFQQLVEDGPKAFVPTGVASPGDNADKPTGPAKKPETADEFKAEFARQKEIGAGIDETDFQFIVDEYEAGHITGDQALESMALAKRGEGH